MLTSTHQTEKMKMSTIDESFYFLTEDEIYRLPGMLQGNPKHFQAWLSTRKMVGDTIDIEACRQICFAEGSNTSDLELKEECDRIRRDRIKRDIAGALERMLEELKTRGEL
jgi:hypothetical protein